MKKYREIKMNNKWREIDMNVKEEENVKNEVYDISGWDTHL